MNVVVLDGNENQAVACVRSLSRAGHRVIVGASSGWSKAGWSRHASESFRYPSPQHDARGFVAGLAATVGRFPGALVLAMTERTTLPISEQRDTLLSAGARLVLPPHEVLLQAFNKSYTTHLAASLGIAVPKTARLTSTEEARQFANEAEYPIVLKPQTSEEKSADGGLIATGRPLYARSAAELVDAYEALRQRCSIMLAQEYVPGAGSGYFALMRYGEPRVEFAHRRIRDVRPTGSGSSVRESVPLDDRMRNAGLSMLRELRWHGPAMVEFRVRADGTPVFLEINGRFWNSLALAVNAGADFPMRLAEMAEFGDVSSPSNYVGGVRCRWLLGDARHLIEVWRGKPPGYPGEFPGRFTALRDFLTPVPGTFHDNFSLDDPLPEVGDWIDFVVHRVLRR